MRHIKLIFTMVVLSVSAVGSAQVKLIKNRKPVSRIVVTTVTEADSTAAALLQDFVQRTTKGKLPIYSLDQVRKVKKGDVLIGNGGSNAELVTDELKEDGFLMTTEDGLLRIVSGGDGGSVYGVASLLEEYLGVRYWGEKEYDLQPTSDVTIPKIRQLDNPAFSHRQTHFYGLSDPIYKLFSRYEYVDELFAGRYWVHTFKRLMPVSEYGHEHPEYYAMVDGKRRLESNTQLCLTNPDVLEIVTHKLDSIFKAHPDRNMISVSQNDGNGSWCRCEHCQKIIEEEGAVSGPYIRFVNELARRFPDKQISTLSYLFTVDPPLHTKPLPNVNIMLCNINCTREVPLDENVSGQQFMGALEKWSAMTRNIFLWDYGINFHNYVSPFPNFHVLADNMKLFRKNHVNTYFHQMSGTRGSDFAELRIWLISKLMWNPDADVDQLIHTFLEGYYGKASATYLYQYIKMMEGALLASRQTLWIYDTPVTFKNSMLNPVIRKRYNKLFDEAENAAANDSTFLARIQRSRLSLQFADLEIGRTYSGYDVEELARQLNYFEKQCKRFDVTRLTEPGLMVDEYCRSYRQRFLKVRTNNLARKAQVTYLIPPSQRYASIAGTALTDGLLGGNTFNQSWVGWEGTDGALILDLGEEKEFRTIDIDFLLALNDWIWPPKAVTYAVSTDNKEYREAGKEKLEGKNLSKPYFEVHHELGKTLKGRYIRIDIEGQKIIPSTANKCWFFMDEIVVD